MKARFVLDREKAVGQYEQAKAVADTVSYSYKTNFEVGKVLRETTETFFSVHSMESLAQLGCHDRVWFFAQSWNAEDVKKLLDMGVSRFVVDNQRDLDILRKNVDAEIELLLRMKLKEHTIHTGKHFVYGMSSKKINELLPELRRNKHIERLGIHFHRKTQNVSEWSLKAELEDSIEHWDIIDMVNIGGGIPATYKNFRAELDRIFEKIAALKTWLNEKGIEMIIEPGRFIAASPVRLEAEIINIYDDNIVVNCSVYNAAMDTFVAHIRLLVEGEKESGDAYTIKGCTPDSMDIFRYRVYLDRPQIGDKLVFLHAGAYNYTTNFCNLPKLETVIE